MTGQNELSRRERQILDILYKLESGSVKDVQDALDDGSSDSTIRTLLGILVNKKKLVKKPSGMRYIYSPAVERKKASRQALERVVSTFFEESPVMAVRSLLEMKKGKITLEEVEQLEALLNKTKPKKK